MTYQTAPSMPRPYRALSVFEMRCFQCNCLVEIPVVTVVGNIGVCTGCGTKLELRWSEPIQ